MDQLAKLLKSNDHSCVAIVGVNKNHEFEWCQKDECPKTRQLKEMHSRQAEQEKLLKNLKKKGHTCIESRESYPMQVVWCEQESCKNIKK